MNLYRVSKKTPHVDTRQTLATMHYEKMDSINNYYETLPEKKKLLEQLKKKALSLPTQVSSRLYSEVLKKRVKLEKDINDLIVEIEKIENRTEEYEYISKAAPFIEKYNKDLPEPKQPATAILIEESGILEDYGDTEAQTDEDEAKIVKNVDLIENYVEKQTISTKGGLCSYYAKECLDTIMSKNNKIYLPKEDINKSLKCEDCNVLRNLIIKEAIAVCPECGSVVKHQDSTHHSEFSEEVEILSPFALSLALKSMIHCISRHCAMKFSKISGIILISC